MGLAAVGIAVCCAFPVLLSLGAGITIAGLAFRSWLLAIAGLVVVATIAALRVRRRRPCSVTPSADQEEGTTDAHRRGTR